MLFRQAKVWTIATWWFLSFFIQSVVWGIIFSVDDLAMLEFIVDFMTMKSQGLVLCLQNKPKFTNVHNHAWQSVWHFCTGLLCLFFSERWCYYYIKVSFFQRTLLQMCCYCLLSYIFDNLSRLPAERKALNLCIKNFNKTLYSFCFLLAFSLSNTGSEYGVWIWSQFAFIYSSSENKCIINFTDW